MFTGVTGLKAHTTKMDVIGNNIANVNTIGFKRQTVEFQTLVSQMIRNATPSTESQGGRNPMQVGLGVEIGAITTDFKPGGSKSTGVTTDLAINGEGFFVLEGTGGQNLYTRAGNFRLDADGYLVSGDLRRVLGWRADSAGNVNTGGPIESLQFKLGETMMNAKATENVVLSRNLNADTAVGESVTVDSVVYDSQGRARMLSVTFTKMGDNEWSWEASIEGIAGGIGTINFDASGNLTGTPTGTVSVTLPDGVAPMNVTLDYSQLQQQARETTVVVASQDGWETGFLQEIVITPSGDIYGIFDNAVSKRLGTLAIATFDNPAGLIHQAGTSFSESLASGKARIGRAEVDGAGSISSGTLEMSNVDLSEEFVEMIITQRGFQANSRTITTADQIVEEVIALKRR